MLQPLKVLILMFSLCYCFLSCKSTSSNVNVKNLRNSSSKSGYVPFPGLAKESLRLSTAKSNLSVKDEVFLPYKETVYRFFNPTTGAHLYTVSEVERDYIIENLSNFKYENATYLAVNKDSKGAMPVYRFYNTSSNVHFYTINEGEKDYIQENLSHFNYEGVGYYAHPEAKKGTIGVHRFYRPAAGIHFFTPSENEKKYVAENLPHYTYEGVAFHAYPIGSPAQAPKSFSISATAKTNDNTPAISWQASEGATDYDIRVSKASNCSDPVFEKDGLTSTSATLSALEDGTYYICVGAVNEIGSFRTARNNAFKLEIDTQASGNFAIQGLSQPQQGVRTLSWTQSSSATSYEAAISTNPNCSSPVFSKTVTQTSTTIQQLADGTYFLCVTARDDSNNAKKASNSGLKVELDTTGPGAFSINAVEDTYKRNPQLSWTASEGSASYKVQLSSKADCTSPLFQSENLTTNSITTVQLDIGKYYICAFALDENQNPTPASNQGISFSVLEIEPLELVELQKYPIALWDDLLGFIRTNNLINLTLALETYVVYREARHSQEKENINRIANFLMKFGIDLDTDLLPPPSSQILRLGESYRNEIPFNTVFLILEKIQLDRNEFYSNLFETIRLATEQVSMPKDIPSYKSYANYYKQLSDRKEFDLQNNFYHHMQLLGLLKEIEYTDLRESFKAIEENSNKLLENQ